MLVVLTGAIIFASDLSREIFSQSGVHTDLHLIKTSVYDTAIKDTGEEYRAVNIVMEPNNISGKDIIIVEDITDQGFTLTWLIDYLLNKRNVKSVKICSLLNKILEKPLGEGPTDKGKSSRWITWASPSRTGGWPDTE